MRRITLGICALGVAVSVGGALLAHHTLKPLTTVSFSAWTGYGALLFLILSQLMAPLGRFRLISSALQAAGRRDFGIACAALASLHVIYGWQRYFTGEIAGPLEASTWLQSGLVAWVILLVLWLTSYPWVVRKLHVKVWKSLHQLTYLCLALSWLHLLLSPWGDKRIPLALAPLIVVMWLLRLL